MRKPESWIREIQRVLGTHEFGPNLNMMISFVLLDDGNEDKAHFLVAKVLLLFRMEVRGSKEEGEFAYAQYIKCSPPPHHVDKVLVCVNLQWSTEDDTDLKLVKSSCVSGEYSWKSGECFKVETFFSIKSPARVGRQNLPSSH